MGIKNEKLQSVKALKKFNELAERVHELQDQHDKEVLLLENEIAAAQTEISDLQKAYETARRGLNSKEMINTTAKINAAETVVDTLKKDLEVLKRKNIATPKEKSELIRKIHSCAAELNDEACREAGKLLLQCAPYLEAARQNTMDCNELLRIVTRGDLSVGSINMSTFVLNVESTINHNRRHFPQYVPR